MPPLAYDTPSPESIKASALDVFGKVLCKFQLQAVEAQLARNDLILVSPTGSGKTLVFWSSLGLNKDGIIILVTPLNVLGALQSLELENNNIASVAVTSENLNNDLIQEIQSRRYRVIVMPPELVMDERFVRIWQNPLFLDAVDRIIFDESHVIPIWGEGFRASYLSVQTLRHILPYSIPYTLATATAPPHVLDYLIKKMSLSSDYVLIKRSNDRPNIALQVRPMFFPKNSHQDLSFLVPTGALFDTLPKCWLCFFDSRKETEGATDFLRARLSINHRQKILWFHSGMTADYKKDKLEDLRVGKILGICCTDAAGMGIDLAGILLVVNYGAPKSLCTYAQRFGRGARDFLLKCITILIVETKWLGAFIEIEKELPKKETKELLARLREELLWVWKYINAEDCRRVILLDYFKCLLLGDEEYCCDRCSRKSALPCCDNCHPDAFLVYEQAQPRTAPVAPRRKVLMAYIPTLLDIRLQALLEEWRDNYMVAEYGDEAEYYDSSMVMDDSIVERIVDLAHSDLLPNVRQLHEQTRWALSAQHGEEILELVRSVRVDDDDGEDDDDDVVVLVERRPVTCSECQAKGHIRTSRICPKYHLTHPSAANTKPLKKENTPPSTPSRSRRAIVASAPRDQPLASGSQSNGVRYDMPRPVDYSRITSGQLKQLNLAAKIKQED